MESTPEPYAYRFKALAKVVDGDTLDLVLDLGFSMVLLQRMRLLGQGQGLGLDAPEIRSKDSAEKAKGLESQAFVSRSTLTRWRRRGLLAPGHHWLRKNPTCSRSRLLWHRHRCSAGLRSSA
jgi:hypothetical protein